MYFKLYQSGENTAVNLRFVSKSISVTLTWTSLEVIFLTIF